MRYRSLLETQISEVRDIPVLRLYRYFLKHENVARDRVMHWCGFPSPKEHPVIAYVEFQNAVMRLNAILKRHGKAVVGGVSTRERYTMKEAA